MHRADLRVALCAAATLFALASAPSARSATIAGAQDGWAAVTACAKVPDKEARRDCTDGVLRRAGLLDGPAIRASTASDSPGAAPATPKGRRNDPSQQYAWDNDKLPPATITKANIDGEGKLVLATSDGVVWRSEDTDLQPPKPGQIMTFKAFNLGLYECRVGRADGFLCRKQR